MKNYKHNYFYKITNKINGHFYYGIHSTDNLKDNYKGSGNRLHKAYKKYGIENFKKEILKFFETREELAAYEKEIVDESLIKNKNCYNVQQGGETINILNCVVVKDADGNRFVVHKSDEQYINGDVKPIWTGKHHTKESSNKIRNSMKPKNSKNHRTWINKNGVVKYLNNKFLDEYLKNGWDLGRTDYIPRKGYSGISIGANKKDKIETIKIKKINKKIIKKELLKQKKQENELSIKTRINLIQYSGINFNKLGWVTKVSCLINVSKTQVVRFMKKNMSDFYKKCYKR